MSKHLILVGGGHAHMTVMLNLREYIERGHRVTLIGPSANHYYSGMGPLLSSLFSGGEIFWLYSRKRRSVMPENH